MNKRNLAAVLWFFAGWSGGGLLTGIFGLPSIAGLAPGIVLAGLVLWDPAGWLWERQPKIRRVVRPINEFAAQLDKNAAAPAASAQEQHISR